MLSLTNWGTSSETTSQNRFGNNLGLELQDYRLLCTMMLERLNVPWGHLMHLFECWHVEASYQGSRTSTCILFLCDMKWHNEHECRHRTEGRVNETLHLANGKCCYIFFTLITKVLCEDFFLMQQIKRLQANKTELEWRAPGWNQSRQHDEHLSSIVCYHDAKLGFFKGPHPASNGDQSIWRDEGPSSHEGIHSFVMMGW